MSKYKRIFIVGHMGAGKFKLGEALAKKLGWQLIDANPGLEWYIGRSLNEIVGKQGETAFHQCEAEILSHYKAKENSVIILEEGVIATEENRKLLSSEFVVYLQVSTSVQQKRLYDSRTPLLPIADLKAFLERLHQERDNLYEQVAKITINSDAGELDKNVDEVVKELN